MYRLERFAELTEPCGLVHGFSTREDGNLGFRYGPKGQVINLRSSFTRRVHPSFLPRRGVGMVPQRPGFEEDIVSVEPELHGCGMHAPDSGPPCEAMIAAEGFLFVATGDCPAIVVADCRTGFVALIHASRESTIREISRKTVERMVSRLGTRPADLVIGMGPGIRRDSYVLQTFAPADQAGSPWQRFVQKTDEGVSVDLFGYNRHLFEALGVPPGRIIECPFDTFTDQRFASHRRSKANGEPEWRHGCAFGIVPSERA